MTVKHDKDGIRQERVCEVVVTDYLGFVKALNELQWQFEQVARHRGTPLIMEIWIEKPERSRHETYIGGD